MTLRRILPKERAIPSPPPDCEGEESAFLDLRKRQRDERAPHYTV